jgi:hypothetical protein
MFLRYVSYPTSSFQTVCLVLSLIIRLARVTRDCRYKRTHEAVEIANGVAVGRGFLGRAANLMFPCSGLLLPAEL